MSRVEVVFYSSFTQKGRWRSGDNSTLIGSRHKLSLKGVLQLDLNRFALYRQLKVCFWSEFTKNQLKKFTQRGDRENCDIQKVKTQWKSFRISSGSCLI